MILYRERKGSWGRGCVSHWTPADRGHNRMAVNARLMDPEILSGARVRYLDGAND